MPQRHVVVDGSNIATEGRSLPSLAQLDQAVREFLGEFPDDIVTVVVDASFAHRIDSAEVTTFEEAEAAGEVVSPPAGAIGRGDAFLLRIADKTGATVLSNDSFQEFHGEHEWLFEADRLIGGKPVPGVGWIFTPRTPVRGPKSREAVKEAKRKKRAGSDNGSASGLDLAASRGRGRGKKVERAIAAATEEAVEPSESKRRRRRKNSEPPADPINEPLAFITFIAGHPLGSEVEGTVESFSSHGAFVDADGARCYVPLSAMGEPAPRSAREVMNRGETRPFVIQALDPLRRGIELAVPGFAKLSGAPTDETVEAETHPVSADDQTERAAVPTASAKKAGARRRPAVAPPLAEGEDRGERPAIGASKAAPPVRRAPPLKAPAAPAYGIGPIGPTGPAVPAGVAATASPAEVADPMPGDPRPAKAVAKRRPAKKAAPAEPEPVGPATAAERTAPAGTAGGTGPAKAPADGAKRSGGRKGTAKALVQKTTVHKAPAPKAPVKKVPAKKAPASPGEAPGRPVSPPKAAAKATTKKATSSKATAGKTVPTKAVSTKAVPTKAAAGKAAPKKSPAKKIPAKKAAAKKAGGSRAGEHS